MPGKNVSQLRYDYYDNAIFSPSNIQIDITFCKFFDFSGANSLKKSGVRIEIMGLRFICPLLPATLLIFSAVLSGCGHRGVAYLLVGLIGV
ncbi:MAG: hypothetical protein ABIX01_18940 [Chitinophagaceae bacterium]